MTKADECKTLESEEMGGGSSHEPQLNEESSQTETQISVTGAKVVGKTVAQVQLKPPHNCEDLLRDADSPVDRSSMNKLYDQLRSGLFLNQNKKVRVKRKHTHGFILVFFFFSCHHLLITIIAEILG